MSNLSEDNSIHFPHRVTGQELDTLFINELDTERLADAMDAMSHRASATIKLLKPFFEATSQTQPDDGTMFYALNSVLMELADMRHLMEQFAQAQKKPL